MPAAPGAPVVAITIVDADLAGPGVVVLRFQAVIKKGRESSVAAEGFLLEKAVVFL